MDNIIYILLFILLVLFIIYFFMIHRRREKFENLFTNGSCCSEDQIRECNTFGKSGVCNYFKNNNSCLCQNAD